MVDLFLNAGRAKLRPSTSSFNIVLNCIASSATPPSFAACAEAETLVHRMEALRSNETTKAWRTSCAPDQLSFNLVLKCWARSDAPNAAQRAEDILAHMERRFAGGITSIRPDVATYNTVLTAWAKQASAGGSRVGGDGRRGTADAEYAVTRADQLLERMESTETGIKPNALSYNILINAHAQQLTSDSRSSTSNPKNRTSAALDRTLELLARMKRLYRHEGRTDCRPDVYTYTGVCNALAKVASVQSSSQAEELLLELEEDYQECCRNDGGMCGSLKPSRQLYTSVRFVADCLDSAFTLLRRRDLYLILLRFPGSCR
jgi:Pentatricopeptide repeat domain